MKKKNGLPMNFVPPMGKSNGCLCNNSKMLNEYPKRKKKINHKWCYLFFLRLFHHIKKPVIDSEVVMTPVKKVINLPN